MDTTRPEGHSIFGIFAALTEFEQELIGERIKAGIAAARRRANTWAGRPSSPPIIGRARALIETDKETKAGAAALAQRRCDNAAAGHAAGTRRKLSALRAGRWPTKHDSGNLGSRGRSVITGRRSSMQARFPNVCTRTDMDTSSGGFRGKISLPHPHKI